MTASTNGLLPLLDIGIDGSDEESFLQTGGVLLLLLVDMFYKTIAEFLADRGCGKGGEKVSILPLVTILTTGEEY